MLMFISVQLRAKRKSDFLHDDTSRHVFFPNNTDKKKKRCGTDSSVLAEALLKIPLIGAWGFPLSTPVCGPGKPNIHNNVNIENISLKNDVEWPH